MSTFRHSALDALIPGAGGGGGLRTVTLTLGLSSQDGALQVLAPRPPQRMFVLRSCGHSCLPGPALPPGGRPLAHM